MKKLFALLLVLVMVVGVLPTMAFAAEAKCELPEIEWPKCELPEIEWPKCELPEIEWPKCELPEIEWPECEPGECPIHDDCIFDHDGEFTMKDVEAYWQAVDQFWKDLASKLPSHECPKPVCPECGKPECGKPVCGNCGKHECNCPSVPEQTDPNKSPATGVEMESVVFASVMMVSAVCVAAYVMLSKREEVR